MPYVEELANRFGLSVVDNQADVGSVLMTQPESKVLVESWLRHNGWAIHTILEDPSFSNPLRMSIASSMYLWRYGMAKGDLERVCGEEIFVPNLVPLHRKGSTLVERGFTCTQGVPMIVPDGEWVFVVRGGEQGLFHRQQKREVGVISVETFRGVLRDCVQPYEWSGLELGILRAESLAKAGKRLQSIDHMLDRSEVELTRTDSFVDIQLPGDKQ